MPIKPSQSDGHVQAPPNLITSFPSRQNKIEIGRIQRLKT
jgi:hypothetical protein